MQANTHLTKQKIAGKKKMNNIYHKTQYKSLLRAVAVLHLLLVSFAFSDELLIDARRVIADEKAGIVRAEDSVHITKQKDELNADKVHIYMNKERKPFKFEAIGNVDFHIFTEDGRELKGKSDKLIYLIQQSEYQLIGRAETREVGKPNFLKGEKIIFNNKENTANVQSEGNAPVRVIIDLNDITQK